MITMVPVKKVASNVRTFRLAYGNGLFVLRCPFFTGALVFASWVNVEMVFNSVFVSLQRQDLGTSISSCIFLCEIAVLQIDNDRYIDDPYGFGFKS